MENGIGPRQSPVEVLGMDRGWVGNGCGPNQRIRHGYDTYMLCKMYPQHSFVVISS